MASELSGRRCDVMIWHDTNHQRISRVCIPLGKADQNWGPNPDPSPRRDVAVPLLIPFIGAETKPLLPTYLRPASNWIGRVVDPEEEVTQLLIQGWPILGTNAQRH
jgi:hypothetical protein